MIAPDRPTPPGVLGRAWNWLYEYGYQALRALVLLLARPLFLVRRVGNAPTLPDGPLIVCANHASYLDPGFIQVVLDRRLVFVMTNDFYKRWPARWFFKLVRAIPVGSGRLAHQGIERAVSLLRDGQAIGIFPEGRLSPDGSLGPARRGVAILARMGHAPVVTLGLDGNRQAWPRGSPWFSRANVRVAIGETLPPPPAHPAPGREEERAYAARVMDGVRQARERARASGGSSRTVDEPPVQTSSRFGR